MSLDDQRRAYARATTDFLDLARAVPTDQWDRSVGDGWTPRQVVHHLADAEIEAAGRLRRLLAEAPGSPLLAFDESALAESPSLGYRTDPVEPSLELIGSLRTRNLAILGRLDESDLERWAEHSAAGRYTLSRWLDAYSAHPSDHANQVRAVLEG